MKAVEGRKCNGHGHKDDEWLESVVGLVVAGVAGEGRNECRVSGQPLVKTTLVASSGDLPFTEPLL